MKMSHLSERFDNESLLRACPPIIRQISGWILSTDEAYKERSKYIRKLGFTSRLEKIDQNVDV